MTLPFKSPPRNLCVLRLSAIGDVCHALAVVRAIQAHWPQTKITWIIGVVEATLLGDISGVEFITFDKKKGWRAIVQLRRTLRGREFDALLNMQVSLRASVVGLCVTSPIRLGYDRARAKDLQWLFNNYHIPVETQQHVLDSLLGFAAALGINDCALHWDIPMPEAARAYAQQMLPGEQPTLVISPCSSARFRNWRNWAAVRYAAVADHAMAQHGMRVVLCGGPTALEQDYGRRITSLMHSAPLNLIGQTQLKQLLAVIARGTVLISPDSGPAHMATAVNTPVIGLYATSNPRRTGPYLSQQWVVNKYPDAVRAEFGKEIDALAWGQRVRRADAMDLIKVDDVTHKLDELMRERKFMKS